MIKLTDVNKRVIETRTYTYSSYDEADYHYNKMIRDRWENVEFQRDPLADGEDEDKWISAFTKVKTVFQ